MTQAKIKAFVLHGIIKYYLKSKFGMQKSLLYDLNEVKKLFKSNKIAQLRGLGKRLIREAALGNNYGKAELGVIAYAIHKIDSKEHFVNSPKWSLVKERILINIEEGIIELKKNNLPGLMINLKEVIIDIQKIDSKLGNYATGIYEKAKVKQASLAYSYGLSISQATDLTGADRKDLQAYIGFTKMSDEEGDSKSIEQRVKNLEELLIWKLL